MILLILQLILSNILSLSYGITENFVGCPCTVPDTDSNSTAVIHKCERIIDSACPNFSSGFNDYCCSGIDNCSNMLTDNNTIAGGFR